MTSKETIKFNGDERLINTNSKGAMFIYIDEIDIHYIERLEKEKDLNM